MAEKYLVELLDETVTFEIEQDGETVNVRREGSDEWRRVELEGVGDSGLYLLTIDNHPLELYLERRRGGAVVTTGRHIFDIGVQRWRPGASARRRGPAAPKGLVRIMAPMTGSIVEVRCTAGEAVSEGQVLLVIESMKMNNELRSPAPGTVESVGAAPGQRVRAGDVLVTVRAAPSGSSGD